MSAKPTKEEIEGLKRFMLETFDLPCGMMECKKALHESRDLAEAAKILLQNRMFHI